MRSWFWFPSLQEPSGPEQLPGHLGDHAARHRARVGAEEGGGRAQPHSVLGAGPGPTRPLLPLGGSLGNAPEPSGGPSRGRPRGRTPAPGNNRRAGRENQTEMPRAPHVWAKFNSREGQHPAPGTQATPCRFNKQAAPLRPPPLEPHSDLLPHPLPAGTPLLPCPRPFLSTLHSGWPWPLPSAPPGALTVLIGIGSHLTPSVALEAPPRSPRMLCSPGLLGPSPTHPQEPRLEISFTTSTQGQSSRKLPGGGGGGKKTHLRKNPISRHS